MIFCRFSVMTARCKAHYASLVRTGLFMKPVLWLQAWAILGCRKRDKASSVQKRRKMAELRAGGGGSSSASSAQRHSEVGVWQSVALAVAPRAGPVFQVLAALRLRGKPRGLLGSALPYASCPAQRAFTSSKLAGTLSDPVFLRSRVQTFL